MKILKNKQKSGFKGTIIKIGLVVLIAFMIFGALKSCIKVKASVFELEVNQMYGWNPNISSIDYIGNFIDSFSTSDVNFRATFYAPNLLTYNGVNYYYLVVDKDVYNNGLSELDRIYYLASAGADPFVIYTGVFSRSSTSDFWDVVSSSMTDGVSPYFVINNTNITLSVSGLSGTFSVEDTLYQFITYVSNNSGYDLYQQGYIYGYNKALAEFDSRTYYNSGYNTGYDDGFVAGRNDLTNPLLNSGYVDGYNSGYNVGYEDGVNLDNPYTFKTLFFSALEAPVTVIAGALNFDFLGYNLKDFVFSLFTIAIIAFIVKRLI